MSQETVVKSTVPALAPGLHPGVADEAHHADPALGSTDLKNLLRSPARWRHERDHPRPATASMDVGSVCHALVLGVGSRYVVSPYTEHRTADAKTWVAEQRAAGRIVVKAAEYAVAEAMADAVWAHPIAGELIDQAVHVETTGVADIPTISEVQVRCKARWDALIPEAGIDLKTTSDPDLDDRELAATTARYSYDLQGAAYDDVLAALDLPSRDHLIVWVSTVPPHFVAVRRLTPAALDRGRELAAAAREIYARCVKTGQWPGPRAWGDLDLPAWAYHTTPATNLEDPS